MAVVTWSARALARSGLAVDVQGGVVEGAGTIADLPEGRTFAAGNTILRVSHVGGSPNDVILTVDTSLCVPTATPTATTALSPTPPPTPTATVTPVGHAGAGFDYRPDRSQRRWLLERGTVAPSRQDSRPDPQASFGRAAGRPRPRPRPSRPPGDAGSVGGTHRRALNLVRLRGDSPDPTSRRAARDGACRVPEALDSPALAAVSSRHVGGPRRRRNLQACRNSAGVEL